MSSTVEKQSEVLYTITKTRTHNFNKVEITAANVKGTDIPKVSDALDGYVAEEYTKLVDFSKKNPVYNSGGQKTFNSSGPKLDPNRPASQAQLNFIQRLGGTAKPGLTISEAKTLIDTLKQGQKNQNIQNSGDNNNFL